MITIMIGLAMVYCTAAGNLHGRGPYGRVMLDTGYTQMDGATQGHEDWTLDKVIS